MEIGGSTVTGRQKEYTELMLSLRVGLLLCLVTGITCGQSFEVASIRLSGPKSVGGSDGGPGSKDPTRFTYNRANLMVLTMWAYDVEEDFQVSSRLSLERDEFDLVARLPPNASKDEFQAMLRNLLAERFQMKVHIESRDFPAFELVAAKGGTKLGTAAATRLASKAGFPELTPGQPRLMNWNTVSGGYVVSRIRGQQWPVSGLAELLRTTQPRPVVDKTGLTGNYDLAFEFSTELPNGTANGSTPADAPDLNTALREQLGLQVIARKLPFKVVVVERFNRLPTEN